MSTTATKKAEFAKTFITAFLALAIPLGSFFIYVGVQLKSVADLTAKVERLQIAIEPVLVRYKVEEALNQIKKHRDDVVPHDVRSKIDADAKNWANQAVKG